jgi:hypothetical protein
MRRFSRLPERVPSKCNKCLVLPLVTARRYARVSSMPACGDDIIVSGSKVGGSLFRFILVVSLGLWAWALCMWGGTIVVVMASFMPALTTMCLSKVWGVFEGRFVSIFGSSHGTWV